MLIAIGIYMMNEEGGSSLFTRKAFAQKESGLGIFSVNLLDTLETKTLTEVSSDDLRETCMFHFVQAGEHHYVKRISCEPYIIVICNRGILDPKEAHYLFMNAWHAFKRPELARVSLAKIIANPIGYTGRDCYIMASIDNMQEVKDSMLRNLDKMIDRGEKLEELQEKTSDLMQSSLVFSKESKKISGCCGWW